VHVDAHADVNDTMGGEKIAHGTPFRRAVEEGLLDCDRVVQIGCELESARYTVEAVDEYPSLLGGVALHPNEIPGLAASGQLDEQLAEIEQLAGHPRVRVIGETGLDHFRTAEDGRARQEESFRRHIQIAKDVGKALVIHDRDAHDDVLRVLREEGAPAHTVFHCFSGDVAMAKECAALGYVMSFAGNVTFKNAQPLRDALAVAPLELLLVETDAPFLTPMPYRGQPNASYLIPTTLRAMAEIKGVALDTLCTAVANNGKRVFGLI